MIKLITKLFIFAILLVSLSSCKKEYKYPYPTDDYNVKSVDQKFEDNGRYISLWGKFLVVDAVMFVVNVETNQKTMYKHFDPNKNTSSMRWGGSMFELETIVKNTTTYSFYKLTSYPGYGKFVLNSDTTKHYAVYFSGLNKTIVEDPTYGVTQQLLGGSAKPFSGQILNYEEKTVVMQIHEAYTSINGYNCKYWTQLTLKKIEEW